MQGTHVLCYSHGVRPRVPAWEMNICDRCKETWQARVEALRATFQPFWAYQRRWRRQNG